MSPPTIVVTAEAEVRPGVAGRVRVAAATLKWWDTWRTSAQAPMFTDTDWSFLTDTAVLHGEFWAGNRNVAAELRLRGSKFGATPEDRARLRIEVGDGTNPTAPRLRAKSAEQREARLLKAVKDGAMKLFPGELVLVHVVGLVRVWPDSANAANWSHLRSSLSRGSGGNVLLSQCWGAGQRYGCTRTAS